MALHSHGVQVGGPGALVSPFLGRTRVARWNGQGNSSTSPGIDGIQTLTGVGTATAVNVATGSIAARMKRTGYPSAAGAGSLGGARCANLQYGCGSGTPGDGSGFLFVERFVESDPAVVAGRRAFAGMKSTVSAPANVEPNTLTNLIGVGQLSTDATQWYVIYGGSSAQTAIALGAGLGAPAGNSTTAWELMIYAPSGVANTFYVTLTNLTTGVSVTTPLTGAATVVPQSTTLLAWQHWVCNNATALVCGCDIAQLYFETDF